MTLVPVKCLPECSHFGSRCPHLAPVGCTRRARPSGTSGRRAGKVSVRVCRDPGAEVGIWAGVRQGKDGAEPPGRQSRCSPPARLVRRDLQGPRGGSSDGFSLLVFTLLQSQRGALNHHQLCVLQAGLRSRGHFQGGCSWPLETSPWRGLQRPFGYELPRVRALASRGRWIMNFAAGPEEK